MVNNPQFPHSCRVSRFEADPDDQYAEPTETIILEGLCQNQINEVGDTVWKEGVLYSDYTAYLPLYTEMTGFVKKGDMIEVNDNVRILKGTVVQFEKGNIGIRIWFDGLNGSPK